MQRILVEEKRWIGQRRFLHALNYCMLLPGPEAQQLATYIGWLLNGVRGGLAAGILFVVPGVIALLALSAIYVAYGETSVVAAIFGGLAPAVAAIVAQAVLRVGRRALGHPALVAIAAGAFVALAVFAVPFPVARWRREPAGCSADSRRGPYGRAPPTKGTGRSRSSPTTSFTPHGRAAAGAYACSSSASSSGWRRSVR